VVSANLALAELLSREEIRSGSMEELEDVNEANGRGLVYRG
jgi:hypothetical protein